MTNLTKRYATLGAAFTLGTLLNSTAALAQAAGNDINPVEGDGEYAAQGGFSEIFERIGVSFEGLPGLLSIAAYILGIVFAIAGILKIKDHVEDPSRTQLKDGAIRLIVGGALFALPFVMTIMTQTIGDQDSQVGAATLNRAKFGVNDD